MPGGTIGVPQLLLQFLNGESMPETQDEWGSWSKHRGNGGLRIAGGTGRNRIRKSIYTRCIAVNIRPWKGERKRQEGRAS